MNNKKSSLLGASLVVAGTSIGGAMLALPVVTSLGGFIPAIAVFFVSWLFMAFTGLLLLEFCHWMGSETNIVSMAGKTLGNGGKVVAWIGYLFLFYCLVIAYIVGCGNLIDDWLFDGQLPDWAGPLSIVVILAPAIFFGPKVTFWLNGILMTGLILTYFGFLFFGFGSVKSENLLVINWPLSLSALPIALLSFGYQGVVPTLSHYLNDLKRTRLAIVIGTFIPFLVYIVWEWLILGIVPVTGKEGLAEALVNGDNAVYPLKFFLNEPLVTLLGEFLGFCALATSFIGVSLGLVDFLADGLKIQKNRQGKALLCSLVFIPPLIIGVPHPHLFLIFLDLAGGYGGTFLLGLLPILMFWSGKYRLHFASTLYIPFGRGLLGAAIVFIVMVALIAALAPP